MKTIYYKWAIGALITICATISITSLTSCTSNRQVARIIADHTLELAGVNSQLETANAELERQTGMLEEQTGMLKEQKQMLDSLLPLVGMVDTIFSHTELIIDNTDSIVRMNNQMLLRLQRLYRIESNTDTILDLLRQPAVVFEDVF